MEDENKRRKDVAKQRGVRVTFLTLINTFIQVGFLYLMMTYRFKMFSIIPFFTGPIWVLTVEAILLVITKAGK